MDIAKLSATSLASATSLITAALAKIWPASNTGAQLNRTKIERELVAAAPMEQVMVAAIYR